jgi:hypothetical protein
MIVSDQHTTFLCLASDMFIGLSDVVDRGIELAEGTTQGALH